MKRLSPFSTPSDLTSLVERAVRCLREGGIVVYPTDTVYGLGGAAGSDEAVRRVFVAKGRPLDKPLPLLLASPDQVEAVASDISPAARRLIAAFWPGGVTLVLRRKAGYHSLALAGADTIGLRVPNHPVARRLIEMLGEPITGTSANRAGAAGPLTAGEAREQLGDRVDVVIDGGPCPGGIESTVVDCTAEPPRLLREGAVAWSEIERVIAAGEG